MSDSLSVVMGYHRATKHHFNRYARGPDFMDWATQPDPFRRYQGAPLIALERMPRESTPAYDLVFSSGSISPQPLNARSIGQLFLDSLAISAWKRSAGEAWALRINPSSGNLHPTEGYLICGAVQGLAESPVVCHYAPREHALEVRTQVPFTLWEKLLQGFPWDVAFFGLTSIHWRESWKYGERAYRYCALDVGHALGAIRMAAAGLGWQVSPVENLSSEDLSLLLGLRDAEGAEEEEPDCLLAVYAGKGDGPKTWSLNREAIPEFEALSWLGRPNRLSRSHVKWQAIDHVAEAARKPGGKGIYSVQGRQPGRGVPSLIEDRPVSLREVISKRRSAAAMDGVTRISLKGFYHILSRTLPGIPPQVPFDVLCWDSLVHLALFVHRVDGLEPGLYILIRNPARKSALKGAMHGALLWEKPQGCPESLELYLLARGDMKRLSMQISCFQEIASDGCFSVGMIAEFRAPLQQAGPWFYPRLFWECGMIGQMLYLEAEAAGLRGTGIGCFFDDGMHDMLGLQDTRFQDLYHFTVGGAVEDPRMATLPAYPE